VTIHDGDVYLVPQGYHGPSIAPPEYPMYFLNVLAGPADDRTMAFCDDPAHHWIREEWESQDPDPRCPMTSATGRLDR
jgi:5-deoxy-glucuronate isomerase